MYFILECDIDSLFVIRQVEKYMINDGMYANIINFLSIVKMLI